METFKTLSVFTLLGAVLGNITGLLIARVAVPWYHTPGNSVRAQCDCAELSNLTVSDVTRYSFTSMAVGAVLMLIVGVVVAARGKRKNRLQAPPPPVAPAV